MSIDSEDRKKKLELVELVKEAIRRDDALREKYSIGEKFRFVRDRLHTLLDQLEKHADAAIKKDEGKKGEAVGEDEVLVYVYLYNTQGMALHTWLNMLTPKLFYEYSVNRPIYLDQNHVVSLIRTKSNKVQHAFLTIAVKKVDLIEQEEAPKDALGNRVVKVRDGSLPFNKLIAFTHSEQDYVLTDQRTLVRK